MSMPSIYIIKSKTSGKYYIGQTNTTTKKRWEKHLGALKRKHGCSALYLAIKKYGINDFDIKTIKRGNFTKKELNKLEKKYIKKLNTLSPRGYNLQTGGNSFELAQETKDKISEAHKGRKIEWSDKIRSTLKEKWKDKDYRKRMSEAHKGKRKKYKKHKKPLRILLDTKEIRRLHKKNWSINKIAKKYNVCWQTIEKRIKK